MSVLKIKTVTDDTGFSCIFNDDDGRVSKHEFFKSMHIKYVTRQQIEK